MAELTVTGIGRLTRDADVKNFSSGKAYNTSICVYRRENKKQEYDFIDIDLWQRNDQPDASAGLIKGAMIHISSGQLRNNRYIGREGDNRSMYAVHVNSFEFLDAPVVVEVPMPPKYKGKATETAAVVVPVATIKAAPALAAVSVEQEFSPDDSDVPDWYKDA